MEVSFIICVAIASLSTFLWLVSTLVYFHRGIPQEWEVVLERAGLGQKLVNWTLWLTATYTITLSFLLQYWYNKHGVVDFHWYDDWDQWNQLDKCGHAFSAFWIGKAIAEVQMLNGVKRVRASAVGTVISFFLVSLYELFDGFAPDYGASPYDLLANASGSVFAFAQLASGKIWILPRIGFHTTAFAALRPQVLGQGALQQWLKDYNGQTYWLTINPRYVLGWKWWPAWVGFGLGYGADNMLYGRLWQNQAAGLEPYRQFYVGLHLDLTGLHTHRWLLVRRLSVFYQIWQWPGLVVEVSQLAGVVRYIFLPGYH